MCQLDGVIYRVTNRNYPTRYMPLLYIRQLRLACNLLVPNNRAKVSTVSGPLFVCLPCSHASSAHIASY